MPQGQAPTFDHSGAATLAYIHLFDYTVQPYASARSSCTFAPTCQGCWSSTPAAAGLADAEK